MFRITGIFLAIQIDLTDQRYLKMNYQAAGKRQISK